MVKGKWGREKGFKQKEETKAKISAKVKLAYKKWKLEHGDDE
jgi:hypothetical protein